MDNPIIPISAGRRPAPDSSRIDPAAPDVRLALRLLRDRADYSEVSIRDHEATIVRLSAAGHTPDDAQTGAALEHIRAVAFRVETGGDGPNAGERTVESYTLVQVEVGPYGDEDRTALLRHYATRGALTAEQIAVLVPLLLDDQLPKHLGDEFIQIDRPAPGGA